ALPTPLPLDTQKPSRSIPEDAVQEARAVDPSMDKACATAAATNHCIQPFIGCCSQLRAYAEQAPLRMHKLDILAELACRVIGEETRSREPAPFRVKVAGKRDNLCSRVA